MKSKKNPFMSSLFSKIIITFIVYVISNNFNFTFDFDNLIKSAFIGIIVTYLLEFIFNKWVWRIKIIRKVLGIKIPIVHGRWVGYIESVYSKFQKKYPIAIEFIQTYNSLKLTYYDENAISRDIISEFFIDDGEAISLFCIYLNEPVILKKGFQMHYGTMKLNIKTKTMIGTYSNFYSQRQTYGNILLKYESKKLKKSL